MYSVKFTDDEFAVLKTIIERAEEGEDISGLVNLQVFGMDTRQEGKTVLSLLEKLGMAELKSEVKSHYA